MESHRGLGSGVVREGLHRCLRFSLREHHHALRSFPTL